MVRQRFQHKVITSPVTLPFIAIICTLFYAVACWLYPPLSPSYTSPFEGWVGGIVKSTNLRIIFAYLIFGFTGYLLREITLAYSLIRSRTTFQVSFYFLLVICFPALYAFSISNFIAPLFYISLFFLFRAYQRVNPVSLVFYAMAGIGLISLLFPQIIYFIPLFYIGLFQFNALSWRTFFAGVVGLAFPYWFLAGHAFFYNDMDLLYQPFLTLVNARFMDYSSITIAQYISFGMVVWLFLVGTFYHFSLGYNDKIRTRIFMNFLVTLGGFLILYIILQPSCYNPALQLLLPLTSLLSVRVYTASHSKTSTIFFMLTLFLLLLIAGFNVWQP